MNCMKCGRETGKDQVFCSQCLELMAERPVKADVTVQLPRRKAAPPKKAPPKKKVRTPEEQILQLKRKNRWLTAAVGFFVTISLLLAFLCVDYFRQLDVQRFLGKNYSTVETTN